MTAQPQPQQPPARDVNDRDKALPEVWGEICRIKTPRSLRSLKRLARQLAYLEEQRITGQLTLIVRSGEAITCKMEAAWLEDDGRAG